MEFDKDLGKCRKVKHLLQHLCRHASRMEKFVKIRDEVHEQFHKTKQTSLQSIDLKKIDAEFKALEAKLEEMLKWEQHIIELHSSDDAESKLLQEKINSMENRLQKIELAKACNTKSSKEVSSPRPQIFPEVPALKSKLKQLELKYRILEKQGAQKESLERISKKIEGLKELMESAS